MPARSIPFTDPILQGHGFITSKIVRVIKTGTDEVIDIKNDGFEIGEVVFTG